MCYQPVALLFDCLCFVTTLIAELSGVYVFAYKILNVSMLIFSFFSLLILSCRAYVLCYAAFSLICFRVQSLIFEVET